MRLTHHDLDAISESIRVLYAETELERLPDTIIELLARLVPGDSTSYNEYEPAAGRLLVIIKPELTGLPEKLPAFEASFQEHPVAAHFQKTSSLSVFKMSDFYTTQQYRKTGIFNEFYRYFDVTHQLSVFISNASQRQICMALNRSRRDFSERDRQVVELLRPHFTQAIANATAERSLRQQSDFMSQALESSAQGIAWVDRMGRVLFVTDCAQRWIAEYFTPLASGSVLPQPLRHWILSQLGNVTVVREPLRISRGAKFLCVRLLENGARLLLILTETSEGLDKGRFAQFGLTPRESEVLRWVAEGKSNPEIAKILGLSPRTIDKHVERTLAKLRVETRQAAMLRTWELQRA